MRVVQSVEIRSTPERLWTYLVRPELVRRWQPGLVAHTPTSEGPAGVGTTFRLDYREGQRLVCYATRLIAFEPPRRLAMILTGGHLGGAEATVSYGLTDLGGFTQLDYLAETEGSGALPRLLGPIFGLFWSIRVRKLLRKLKRLAEA
jgi:uncharacterized protein YndB with AHSA1/START domain